MASRTLLCVEPDEGTVTEIRSAVAPYGFNVQSIPNGEAAVEWARANAPELIVVCVEPRKVGYAICNKLKRSPELQKIPLLLTSGEETQQTFEQHKKLKARADEYLLKPFRRDALVAKLGALVELGEPNSNDDELLLAADLSEEISVVDGDIVEDHSGAHRAGDHAGHRDAGGDAGNNGQAEPSRAMGPFGGAGGDPGFDAETDAAFAAIQTVGDASALPPLPPSEPVNEWDSAKTRANTKAPLPDAEIKPFATELDQKGTEPVAGAGSDSALSAILDLGPAVGDPGPEPTTMVATWEPESSSVGHDVAPEPHEVELSPEAPIPEPPTAPVAVAEPPFAEEAFDVPSPDEVNVAPAYHDHLLESRMSDLNARIESLETERKQLVVENDELKLRLQSQPLSKEKEVLSLREIINRKEKDILDLRDALDAKDRQALDHKDRLREQERSRRDLEEKSIALEKSVMAAQERMAALAHDKEKSIERERALKARLDGALTEIQKAHEEADALKKRLGQAEERGRAELERVRGELEAGVRELEEAHRAEVARLGEERAQADERSKGEHEAELARQKAAHAAELEARDKRAQEELAGQNERAQAELARLRREHDKALAQLKEEQAVQLAAERQAHQAAIEVKERDHKSELQGLRRRHEEELAAADEKLRRELGDAEARRIGDLEAAENRRRAELQTRAEEHHTALAELDRRYFDEKTQTSERHRQELDQAHARAARAEGELAARTEELSETQRRLTSREVDLDATRTELRDRELRLGQHRDRMTELEAKTSEYEDQILRAFQRLRSDDKVIDRAKRALAVALSLLDERGVSAGATTTTATSTPATPTPPPRREGEEGTT